mmetsp:Transcript_102581/g.161942  ORF Transcript_102581/g.161942 Transcript_102581/m.161942 type:complete len:96 (+) Transcript_102581:687-974(+)
MVFRWVHYNSGADCSCLLSATCLHFYCCVFSCHQGVWRRGDARGANNETSGEGGIDRASASSGSGSRFVSMNALSELLLRLIPGVVTCRRWTCGA